MNNLMKKIQNDLYDAVKKNDEITRSTLRVLLSSISAKEKEKRYKISKENSSLTEQELQEKSLLSDEEIIEVISSEIKKRKDAILEFEKGKREDLIEKEKKEIEILYKYLPEQLSEEEIIRIIKEKILEIGAKEIKDMGKVMKEIMPYIKGRADNSVVSQIVKDFLTGLRKIE